MYHRTIVNLIVNEPVEHSPQDRHDVGARRSRVRALVHSLRWMKAAENAWRKAVNYKPRKHASKSIFESLDNARFARPVWPEQSNYQAGLRFDNRPNKPQQFR